jgi:integrase
VLAGRYFSVPPRTPGRAATATSTCQDRVGTNRPGRLRFPRRDRLDRRRHRRQERGLKHSAAHETRGIPVRPALVTLLRAHIKRFGTATDGRVFQTARGGVLQDSGYNEIWTRARKAVLIPPSTGHRSAAAPTTCATRRCC